MAPDQVLGVHVFDIIFLDDGRILVKASRLS
jgi:hypothetical protein